MASEKFCRSLLTKTWRCLLQNVEETREQRRIEEEHDQRKQQINQFFDNLKKKVENEARQKEREREEQEKR